MRPAKLVFVLTLCVFTKQTICCNFYPVGEYLKFVRIPENLQVGDEVLRVEVHPRKNLSLQPVDKEEDAHLFTYRDLNRTHVSVVLAQSVDSLVDSDTPQNVVKFRLGCDFDAGDDLISAYLSVTVYIEDVNDNFPQFLDTPYEVVVDELTPTGLTIFKGIHAFDRDKPNTPNSDVQYTIVSGDPHGHFALESSHKPALVLVRALDYDKGDKEFLLVVAASDRGSPPRSSNATVHVVVQDNDDLPPKFTKDVYRTQIPEFYPILGKRIHKELLFPDLIRAYDQDLGVTSPLRYELVAGNERKLFHLDPFNGTLFLEKEIDLDSETNLPGNTFVLQVQASQVDNPLKTAQARVELEMLDLNDNLPEFEVDFYNISIVENLPNGFSVLQVMATDKDQEDNGEFTYQLSDPEGAFSIEPRSGWLTVRNQSILDREVHASLRMKVYAKEKNPSVVGTFYDKHRMSKWRRTPTTQRPFTLKDKTTYVFPDKLGTKSENIEFFDDQWMSFVNVEVTLLDANDNNPVFVPSNLYEFTVKSNAPVGLFIGKVKAVDPDLGRNGMVLYDLQRTSNLTITSPFQVDAKTGDVSVAESPIVEGRHALFIEASDQPTNPSERRYSLAVVTIDVARTMKGRGPGFVGSPYEFWVGSNVGVGTSIGQIKVNDVMDKNDVSYDLLHGYEEGVPFAVEEKSGVITVIDVLSKYDRPMYDFEAVAIQENTNVSIVTNTTVHVVDVNDERGVLLKGAHSPLIFHVKENIAGAAVGQIFHVNMSSLNSSGNIQFLIANQQDIADEIAIGQDGTIYTQRALDREKRDTYVLTVIAEFTKGLISGAGIYQVTIHVDDDNDNPPVFELPVYEGSINENSKRRTEVKIATKIKAKDADIGQNAVFMYTLFGEGRELFTVDENTGAVTFVGTKLDREEKSLYMLKIIARDRGGLSSEAKLTINILDENDNLPRFTQIVMPLGESIELKEADEKSNVKIYHEKKNNKSSGISNVEARPKNKFALKVDELGPLFEVPESVAIGSTILKLHAIDMDSGSNGQVRYEFISELYIPPYSSPTKAIQPKRYFVINERQGHVIVARSLPPEAEFRLNVSALDGGDLSDQISIRVYVKDVNDHFPMFKKAWYNFNVEEAQYTRRVLGKIDASDADFGQNANLTYFIHPLNKDIPFEISPQTGVFSVNGELDREKEDKYILTVVARDNGQDKKLSSSVSVEVQILDVNDNPPKFFAYDELLEWKHPEAGELSNHNFESVMMLPVYKATLEENAPVGTIVTRVYANDTDFIGNGNGLILYSLPQKKNHINLFTIDSKEGIISTTAKLDYENQSVHNVTVVASDLGSPSLSSTAIVMLTVTDVPDDLELSDKPVFISRYYELEIEENVQAPVELVTLNLTEYYESFKMRYYILNENDTDVKRTFAIDPRNGTLYLVRSPDREVKDVYEIIVRGERQKISRELPHMIYPVADEVLEGMSKFEVKVIVRIKDVNDNAPKFTNSGRPLVTAIPTTAPFGYQVIQLKATDADIGINSDIRYQIINEQAPRFAIDPVTGRVRVVAALTRDAGRVFGFDVKATDKKGADDGKSAIANVFVYVLDENKQLVVVMGGKPMEVERGIENITRTLTGITGYDIRVRRLEANTKTAVDATDMYIYGVDPLSNAIIDMNVLQKSIMKREAELRQNLAGFKVLEVGDNTMSQARNGRLLNTMEISVVALGCIVFVGACTTAICILCVRRSKRKHHKPYSQQRLNAFSTEHLTKYGGLFPSGANQCQELNHSYSEADSYIDVINHNVTKKICPHGNAVEEFGKAHQKCVKNQFETDIFGQKHERMCIKFNQRPLQKRKGQDTSITSVNSSGQDSGIAEVTRCPCGQSSVHTSEESSGCSYEDSLKSNHNPEMRKSYRQEEARARRASFNHQPVDTRQFHLRRQSFSENMQRHFQPIDRNPRITKQISTPNVSNLSNSYFMNNKRKDSRRKEVINEPMVDYDNSEGEDVFDTRIERRISGKHKRGKFLELGGQAAVFVTPAAAEMMRRQGSERLMFARPL